MATSPVHSLLHLSHSHSHNTNQVHTNTHTNHQYAENMIAARVRNTSRNIYISRLRRIRTWLKNNGHAEHAGMCMCMCMCMCKNIHIKCMCEYIHICMYVCSKR